MNCTVYRTWAVNVELLDGYVVLVCSMYLSMCSSLPQATAGLLFYLLKAQPIVTFYKLNVHAGELPLGSKVEGGELFQMSLNNSGRVLLRNQMEWHNSLLCMHMYV